MKLAMMIITMGLDSVALKWSLGILVRFISTKILKTAIFCTLLSNSSVAQQVDVPFSNEAFPQKEELKQALFNIAKGNEYLNFRPEPYYDMARHYYELAQKFNPNNAELNFKLGVCHLNSNERTNARQFFQRVTELNATQNYFVHYYLGYCYQLEGDFLKAKSHYQQFLEINSSKLKASAFTIDQVNRWMKQCDFGLELEKNPLNVQIENAGEKINSPFSDFGLFAAKDQTQLFFTSRRSCVTGGDKEAVYGSYFEDGYFAVADADTLVKNLGKPINSKRHESPLTMHPDGKSMLVFVDDYADGNIYESKKNGEQWSKLKKLKGGVNSKFHETSACYSKDGKRLYFTSNRPISKKQKQLHLDIFFSDWDDEKKKWKEPVRLPSNINSSSDEDAVFISSDGKTLYFASTGHQNIGGFDIFSAQIEKDTIYGQPINLGMPINSPDDDSYFFISENQSIAYFSSVRPGGEGDKDIYKITFLDKIEKEQFIVVNGALLDEHDRKIVDGEIEVVDVQSGTTIMRVKSDPQTGIFAMELPANKIYKLLVNQDGYAAFDKTLDATVPPDNDEYSETLYLSKIKVGEVILINNIFYDLGKYSLSPSSKQALDRLVKMLQDNPSMKIEIIGHTDSRGDEASNLKLSKNRAKAVVDYLVQAGIASNRLTFDGHGSYFPLFPNAEIAKFKTYKERERAHQENRRTEFKIIAN